VSDDRQEQAGPQAAAVQERPELLVVAALAGGFVLAKVLKRIVS
jgi:hypothetical protein